MALKDVGVTFDGEDVIYYGYEYNHHNGDVLREHHHDIQYTETKFKLLIYFLELVSRGEGKYDEQERLKGVLFR
jgi:hypothetical protein